MANPVTRVRDFFAKEPLSAHLIILAIAVNFWAWIIPRGDYRFPERDPLGAAAFISEKFQNIQHLQLFWSTVLGLTVFVLGYSAYRVWTMGLESLSNRADLDLDL